MENNCRVAGRDVVDVSESHRQLRLLQLHYRIRPLACRKHSASNLCHLRLIRNDQSLLT